MNNRHVLFIGLDAAERTLLLKWSAAGHLPHIRALLKRGKQGVVAGLPAFGSGAAWPSFATGAAPARHGRYFGMAPENDGYVALKRAQTLHGQTFWERLSDAGKQVAVVNVPYSTLPADINGLVLLDWATHNPIAGGAVSVPEGLAAEVLEQFGGDPVGRCDNQGFGPDNFATFRDGLLRRTAAKAEQAVALFKQRDWDFFGVVFDESHCMGHQAWHIHDPQHPQHDAAVAEAIGDPLLQSYQAIDAAVGQLVEAAGPETTVMLASVTGMGPNYTANFCVDDMLRGFDQSRPSAALSLIGVARRFWRLFPEPLRKRVNRRALKLKETTVTVAERSRRKAYALPHNDISGVVRLNVAGREPNGCIQPGTEYREVLDRLRKYLQAFTNEDTGEPLINRFVEPRKIMAGPFIEQMPDLLIEWNRSAPIRRIHSPATGTIKHNWKNSRTGDHTSEGLFIAVGSGIEPGTLEGEVALMDFAPTVSAMLGVELASESDGRVVSAVLGAPNANDAPIRV